MWGEGSALLAGRPFAERVPFRRARGRAVGLARQGHGGTGEGSGKPRPAGGWTQVRSSGGVEASVHADTGQACRGSRGDRGPGAVTSGEAGDVLGEARGRTGLTPQRHLGEGSTRDGGPGPRRGLSVRAASSDLRGLLLRPHWGAGPNVVPAGAAGAERGMGRSRGPEGGLWPGAQTGL